MTVREFADKHGCRIYCMPDGDREIKGGYAGDLLSWVMSKASVDNAWLTIMSNVKAPFSSLTGYIMGFPFLPLI